MGPRYTVLSGGQTGVDRAALDAALAAGVDASGWCPNGRWAEDGPIDAFYPLRETLSRNPEQRTKRNVEDADALLVLAPVSISGGTALAIETARRLGRPTLVVSPTEPVDTAVRWLRRVLPSGGPVNVAGPRESEAPGIESASRAWLDALFRALALG